MDEDDLGHVSHCASIVGSFIGKSLIRILAGLTTGENTVACNATMSFANAVKFLDIGESTLRMYLKEGRLQAIKLDNGRLRFEKDELIRFQQKRMSEKS